MYIEGQDCVVQCSIYFGESGATKGNLEPREMPAKLRELPSNHFSPNSSPSPRLKPLISKHQFFAVHCSPFEGKGGGL